MRTVSRYLLREFGLASGAVLLALFVLWIAVDTLVHIDQLAEKGGAALRTVAYRALDVVPLGVPMACVVGVVWSVTRAVRAREITAIRCGGIPLRSAFVPILVATVGIAAALAAFEDRVLMPVRQLRLEAEAGRTLDARPVYRNGRWWYASGSSIFSAANFDASAGVLEDVTVFEIDEQRLISGRIDAGSAVNLEGNTWEFRDALIHDFGGPEGLTQRRSPTLRVDLGLSGADIARALPPIEATTLHKLARRIREHRGELLEAANLEASFHGRLAQPLAVLVLVLLAIPFAVGDIERGDSLPRALLASMVAATAFWVAWMLGVLTARSGFVPPPFPVWGVVLAFLALGAWRFCRLRE